MGLFWVSDPSLKDLNTVIFKSPVPEIFVNKLCFAGFLNAEPSMGSIDDFLQFFDVTSVTDHDKVRHY
jgi:hypothetical protein